MIVPVLAWIGFFSMLSQVLLMRELLVSFEGNELSLGIILAAWLVWSGVGSAVWGLIARKKISPRFLAGLLAASGLVFPLTIIAASLLPLLVEQTRGELAGPASLVYPFLLLLPLCLMSGGLFPAASSALSIRMTAFRALGRVYVLEALGGGVAGTVASFLVTGIPPLTVAVVIGLGNLLLAASLLATRRRLVLAVLFVAGCPLLVRLAGEVNRTTLRSQWKGYRLVESISSPYGKVALVSAEGEPVVFHDRVVLFGAADEQAIEERIHYPLLEHPAPEKVLLLGGGSPSALGHVLKHPSVRCLDFLESDPALIDLFRRHFAKEWRQISSDPRVHVYQADARRFIRTSHEKWDVIIVGLPPPRTVLMNRYYTTEFFSEAGSVLAPGGIIALQLPGAENYISEDLAQFLSCVRNTLSSVFPHVVGLPGSTIQFFGSRSAGLTANAATLVARVKERRLDALYVREYAIPFRLAADRVLELERQTRGGSSTPVNRDFAPIAYYLEFVVWGSAFGENYRALFRWLAHVPYALICVAGLVAAVLPALFGPLFRKKDRLSNAVESCVGTMGLTMLGLQVVLLLGFQASYGFLYQQLGTMTAAFMFGMACGAVLGLRAPQLQFMLPVLQLLTCLWLVVVYFGFKVAAGTDWPLVPYLLFASLSLVTGLLGGWHFVVASSAWLANREGSGSLGTVYAVDLIGAALGAIVVAAFLLPVFGYTGTAGILAVMNLATVALFVLQSDRGC
jgi:spermidine synthase